MQAWHNALIMFVLFGLASSFSLSFFLAAIVLRLLSQRRPALWFLIASLAFAAVAAFLFLRGYI